MDARIYIESDTRRGPLRSNIEEEEKEDGGKTIDVWKLYFPVSRKKGYVLVGAYPQRQPAFSMFLATIQRSSWLVGSADYAKLSQERRIMTSYGKLPNRDH